MAAEPRSRRKSTRGCARVTLNYATVDDAARARALSSLFAALWREEPESVGRRAVIARRRLARAANRGARLVLSRNADDSLRARADALVRSVAELDEVLRRHGMALEDVSVSLRRPSRIAVRASRSLDPRARWAGRALGMINHWLPFHAARMIARRSVESASDPAMRTIVAGAALVLAFYTAQGVAVAAFAGWVPALVYIVSLPLAADVNFLLRDRLRRALQRARTYLLFRRRPEAPRTTSGRLERVRAEAMDIERAAPRRERVRTDREESVPLRR